VNVTIEARALVPDTLYSYRIAAESESGAGSERKQSHGVGSQEATFTTAPAPTLSAETGGVSALGATSATIAGTVQPDGVPATYAFELGVYDGASTQYGVVYSGAAPASEGAVPESLALTGLQPGTTYAYRIVVESRYIDNAVHAIYGAPRTFTTAGLPALIEVPATLALLPTPKCPPGCFEVPAKEAKHPKKHHKRGRKAHHKARHKVKGAHRQIHRKGRGRR
jgi:hypothetical protein